MIDPALLRPGRFDKIIEIGFPDEPARLHILRIHTKDVPFASDVDFEVLSKKTEKFSGADLASLCHEAVLIAIQEHLPSLKELEKDFSAYKVTATHFEKAYDKILGTRKAGRITPSQKLDSMQEEIDRLSFL